MSLVTFRNTEQSQQNYVSEFYVPEQDDYDESYSHQSDDSYNAVFDQKSVFRRLEVPKLKF